MKVALLGAVAWTLALASCSGGPDSEAPAAAGTTAVASVTSTTMPGTEHLDAPDVGCIARAEGLAIDFTGGASDLAEAVSSQFPAEDARVVSANERHAWVVSTESEPPQRAKFYDGGRGWALVRLERCCPKASDRETESRQSGPEARIDASGEGGCVRS